MYIPDPVELMCSRIDNLVFEWEKFQQDVPSGSFRCPYCREIRNYNPIQVGPSPDSAVCCYECLPDDLKTAYDQFEKECGESA